MTSAAVRRRLFYLQPLKNTLPFQKMLADVPVQVIRLRDFHDASSFAEHRHDFYMLLWVTEGKGWHRVQYRELEMLPGRVCFTHEGQVHQLLAYPGDGWLILFKASIYRQFISRYPDLEQQGLLDEFNGSYFVDLDEKAADVYAHIVPLLNQTRADDQVLTEYLSILIYHTATLFEPALADMHPAEADTLRRLKKLISEHFRQQRNAPFYSSQLGMATRKLNELTMRFTGRKVHELVTERLLSEAEILLGSTNLAVKEITYELGFIDNAHFALFFRKHKGLTASEFRISLRNRSTNDAG